MKFGPNRKSYIKGTLAASLILPFGIIFFAWSFFSAEPAMMVPLFLPCGIFLWIYFGTYYIVSGNKFFYRSGFLRGQIDISRIREIIVGTTVWTGTRPATATNGLLIKFNAYDEIYISPESNDALVDALTQANNQIKVTINNT